MNYFRRILLSTTTFGIAIAWNTIRNDYNDDMQYGSHTAQCEHAAMRLGTEMSDVFNAPVGAEDWDERVHQDYLIEQLGFAPWMVNGVHNSNGKSLTKRDAKELMLKGGLLGRDVSQSPYAILNHKWIYMLGDSTTRQVWASFAASFQGNNFERNAKEWSRHYCNKQSHRTQHPKGGHFDAEGWGGPCGANEVTCHVSGYGSGGLLTFDWKHFPWEDYDSWLWSDEGPWIKGFDGEGDRKPDILTVQFGLHTCWHASPQGLYSRHLHEMNNSMIEAHLANVPKLMAAIRRAVDHPGNVAGITAATSRRKPTMVVVVTSGSSGMAENGTSIDDCVLRFNRAAERAAHDHGFAVLERGELERRLMYKSVHTEDPYLSVDMHLPQPAQNIVATCLTHLFGCLNETLHLPFDPSAVTARKHHKRLPPPPKPLHSPPG